MYPLVDQIRLSRLGYGVVAPHMSNVSCLLSRLISSFNSSLGFVLLACAGISLVFWIRPFVLSVFIRTFCEEPVLVLRRTPAVNGLYQHLQSTAVRQDSSVVAASYKNLGVAVIFLHHLRRY